MADILTKKMGRKPKPLVERFWPRVSKDSPSGCWEWMGSGKSAGYGQISRDGTTRNIALTHRLSWELHFGEIPTGAHVLHRCDNPKCVRPDHLFLGTNAENMADKVSKNRQHRPMGSTNGAAKLSADDVRSIRAAYRDGASQARIAEDRGVSQTLVSAIVRRKVWQHV